MPTNTVPPSPLRSAPKRRLTPANTGTADPRPVTEYSVDVSTVMGNTRVGVKLDQPCIIREPGWAFVECTEGLRLYAARVKVVDNTTFYFEFDGELPGAIGFIEPPYQDAQVQNFQGGYVRPGGQWFRKPE